MIVNRHSHIISESMTPFYEIIREELDPYIPVPCKCKIGSSLTYFNDQMNLSIALRASSVCISLEAPNTTFIRTFSLGHPIGYTESQYYLEIAQFIRNILTPYFQYEVLFSD